MRAAAAIFLSVMVCGCVMSTKPTHDHGFAPAADLQSFEGCFANPGETETDAPVSLLSAAIWPVSSLDHKSIETVKVGVASPDTLRVSAVAAGHIVRQDLFVAGKDFKLEAGRIRVLSRTAGSLASEAGNPFIGVASESTVLGVDSSGDARMVRATNIAGTAFLVVPTVGRISDVTRFRKRASPCDGS
jgi:hypothetical protein